MKWIEDRDATPPNERTVDAAGEGGEGDGGQALPARQLQAAPVRHLQQGLALVVALVDGADGMNNKGGRELEPRSDPRLARGTAHAAPDFGHRQACLVQAAARGAVDGAVHAPTTQHPLVRRVDDRCRLELLVRVR